MKIMPEISDLITKPTLIINEEKARRNIGRMVDKARISGVNFRPHFKTHQSAPIGNWFRDFGVKTITVSSVDMASYFADHGWTDITIAFPINIRQISQVNSLAKRIKLGLLVESSETIQAIAPLLTAEVDCWIKVDSGYGRTGINWDDEESLIEVADLIHANRHLSAKGLLTHAGHTYRARAPQEVIGIFSESVMRMNQARKKLQVQGANWQVSVGDTPSCSLLPIFKDVDEIRPGNFVFYDWMQVEIGACQETDIALALACPVVAKHRQRNQVVIYGGAIHLSKEFLTDDAGVLYYGRIGRFAPDGWQVLGVENRIVSLSQEHGIIQVDRITYDSLAIGDLIFVLPVHSCLTANLMGRYLTLTGQWIEMARL